MMHPDVLDLKLPSINLTDAQGVVDAVRHYKREVTKDNSVLKIGLGEFYSAVLDNDPKRIATVKALLEINPEPFGFKGEYYGIEDPPADLESLPTLTYFNAQRQEEMRIWTQYLRLPAKTALEAMNKAMVDEIGQGVLVISGYRSPAYQAQLVLKHLADTKGDFAKAFKWIALPGWSEHGSSKLAAVDLITPDGVGDSLGPESGFESTPQYEWLLKNARNHGFTESFTKGNARGVGYEPWHWAWAERV